MLIRTTCHHPDSVTTVGKSTSVAITKHIHVELSQLVLLALLSLLKIFIKPKITVSYFVRLRLAIFKTYAEM